jgi:hypothetical protein
MDNMGDDLSDINLDLAEGGETFEPEPPPKRPVWPVVAALVALLVLVGGYLYLRAPTSQPAPAAAAKPSTTAGPAEPEVVLPPLDETDSLVRTMIGQLSSNPTVAAWLTTDGLLVNFVVVTNKVARGETPIRDLGVLGPVPQFRPRAAKGTLLLDSSSYRRYDRYADAVSSLDARGTARLYTTLKPRINDAYHRLGEPAADFTPVLERAITGALAVPVVEEPIELVPKGLGYGFADPKLESLSAAQKQLLRMGPRNVQSIQAKLREIADYLGIPASRVKP